MPRIRTIKPEFWVDEKIVELDPWARLLFIGLWNFADDQGYIEYSPKRIKMQIFPGDTTDVVPLLARLLEDGLLAAYDSPMGRVLHVQSWARHQKVSNPATPRVDPADLVPLHLSDESRTEPSRAVQIPRLGKERKGMVEEGKGTLSVVPPLDPDPLWFDGDPVADAPVPDSPRTKRDVDEAFTRFWSAYPRKVSKGDAMKVFARLAKAKDFDFELVVAGAERYRDDGARKRSELKYTKHPDRWLNAKCWLDEQAPDEPGGRASPNGYQPFRNPTDDAAYEEAL